MTFKNIIKTFTTLVASLSVCILLGYIWWYPALPGMPAWYATLLKPLLAPPAWVFPPLWMISFVIMGVVLFLILQSGIGQKDVTFGLIFFVFQFIFILAWAFCFFALHSVFVAMLFIIALWATLLCAVIQVFRFSVYGGMLLVPYFLWVCVLVYLNYGIMVLNHLEYRI